MRGYDEAYAHARKAVTSGRASHAYLIEGAEGAGKATFAREFAKALLCERPVDGQACCQCTSCSMFDGDNHPDMKWVLPNAKGKHSVEDIREQVVRDISILPYRSGKKIYVITHAERLNASCQNAILKTIEEPPAYGVIFLTCENRRALLPTVQSRMVRIGLPPLPEDVVREILESDYHVACEQAMAGAAFCGGSVGQALKMAQSKEFIERCEYWMDFAERLTTGTEAEIFGYAEALADAKKKNREAEVLHLLMCWFRDLLVYKETKDIKRCFLQNRADSIARAAERYSEKALMQKVRFLRECEVKNEHNVNTALWCDWLLLHIFSKSEEDS